MLIKRKKSNRSIPRNSCFLKCITLNNWIIIMSFHQNLISLKQDILATGQKFCFPTGWYPSAAAKIFVSRRMSLWIVLLFSSPELAQGELLGTLNVCCPSSVVRPHLFVNTSGHIFASHIIKLCQDAYLGNRLIALRSSNIGHLGLKLGHRS
jgi:hypothetical protein